MASDKELLELRKRLQAQAAPRCELSILPAAAVNAEIDSLFEGGATARSAWTSRVTENLSQSVVSRASNGTLGSPSEVKKLEGEIAQQQVYRAESVDALFELPIQYLPFVNLTIYPLPAEHSHGVVFIAVAASEAASTALRALSEHLRSCCNACRKNTMGLARMVDARGSVLRRALAEFLQTGRSAAYVDSNGAGAPKLVEGPPGDVEVAWARRAMGLASTFLESADFAPAFPDEAGSRLSCSLAESFDNLFGVNATPLEEVPSFAGIQRISGSGSSSVYAFRRDPAQHASILAVGAPSAPGNASQAAGAFGWTPALAELYETVRVFSTGPTYIRTAMQAVKRMSDALETFIPSLPPKQTAQERTVALQKAMHKNANAWAMTDGITTKVAARPGAAEDESALSVILEWYNADGSQKKVFDLDLEILYYPDAEESSTGGGSRKMKVERIYYGAKYFCTHPNCRKFLDQGSQGNCPVDDHGCAYAISLVHDAQHPAGKATEEVKIGAAVRGRIVPTVRDFNSADSSYDRTGNVYKLSLRAGKQFANKVIHSQRQTIPQSRESSTKPLYGSAELESSLLKALGVDADGGSGGGGANGDPAPASAVEASEIHRRLCAGGGISLPLSAELLGSNAKHLDDAETQKANQIVRDFFGGSVMARMLPLQDLDVVWRRSNDGTPIPVDVETATELQLSGLPESFISALGTSASVCFPVLNQDLMAPSFAFEYLLDGAKLPGPTPSFASFVMSGLPARDGTAAFGRMNATGMFTPAEWQHTVSLQGAVGSDGSVVLRAIVRTPKSGYLFFVVEPASETPRAPSSNGYALKMPTLPLASRASRAPNFKQVSHSLQLLDGDLAFDPAATFGFMVQPGMQFKYFASSLEGQQTFNSKPPEISADNFRPREVNLRAITEVPWPIMHELKAKTKVLLDDEVTRDAYASLGEYSQKHRPSTAALMGIYRMVDLRDILEHEAEVTRQLLEADAGGGGGAAQPAQIEEKSREEVAAEKDPERPPRMPPHIWIMKVQQRKRQQEKRAAAAAKEVKLLAQKQKLIDGLIEQERTKIAQQLVDNAGLKLEELQRQRQALALQRQEFEQQQAREKMLIREDMIQCPITQEAMVDPVSAPDGTSFERASITLWLQSNSTHPCTREPLTVDQLVPNRALKAICDEYHNGARAAAPDAQ